jgi:hypothetical protein
MQQSFPQTLPQALLWRFYVVSDFLPSFFAVFHITGLQLLYNLLEIRFSFMLADKNLFLSILTLKDRINNGVHDRHPDFRDYIQPVSPGGIITEV